MCDPPTSAAVSVSATQWLADLLGVEVPEADPAGGKSLSELISGGGK
mgnify:CR=1 FL=1